ncbi:hypothetical protein RI129_012376 [Pyrocoelia pectoralis]|uniref:Neurotransmitter-gated ion-channel ligand-binding domain-containing protein n=1 Tax=Pyrocoelia pectoralis TaxID=417401 RepID=A0AAN7V2L6_9COLE
MVHVETDELNSTFSSSIWLRLSWKDPKLMWNSNDYNGLDSLKMADHEIWQPDIYLFNSANSGGESIIRYGNPHALVYPDGTVLWVPPMKVTALCEFDMYYWPFDTQHCHLLFGSGTRSRNDIRLVSKGVEFETPIPISQWTIACTDSIIEMGRSGYPDEFYHALYNITLTRKSTTTTTVASTAISCAITLVLVQRFLMFKTGRALILPCITSIVLCMFLIHFGTKVAPKRSTAPWIVSFLATCLFLHCITLMESVFVVYVFKFKNRSHISWRVKRWLNGKLGRFLLLGDCIVQCAACVNLRDEKFEEHCEENEGRKVKKCEVTHEWELSIIAIDRLLFIIYFFIMTLYVLAYVI